MKALIILRHTNRIHVVEEFLHGHGIQTMGVILDPVEFPNETETALQKIRQEIENSANIVILGTKIFETKKSEKTDPPKRLIDFLNILQKYGVGKIPVAMTHLSKIHDDLKVSIHSTGLNIGWVENDNLKNDGMSNLGPLILKLLENAHEK